MLFKCFEIFDIWFENLCQSICSFNKYLFRLYYLTCTVLGDRDIVNIHIHSCGLFYHFYTKDSPKTLSWHLSPILLYITFPNLMEQRGIHSPIHILSLSLLYCQTKQTCPSLVFLLSIMVTPSSDYLE